ncbi:PhoX family protein [Methyloversatilis thermotolerans]|uniref:PhoX family protein n=1 Tax=Methyloversatilis thermotolerans TaxID=1346290 RepID=UPI00039AFEF3|nr:alkaline phosphatase PhoX [Methyloversatilis thermotolerans]
MTLRDDTMDMLRDFSRTDASREMDPHWSYGRRGFLKSGVAAAATLGMPFSMLGSNKAQAVQLPYSPDYGPLAPVADQSTGLPLLQLPAGFKYWSFGWTGDMMTDGIATPSAHDGMAVVASDANKLVLVRNHEQGSRTAGSFANAKITYDPTCNGGTTNLVFAPRTGTWVGAYASISGTIRNCAGGPTPWNSWITCEETSDGVHNGATKQHGFCFDVPATGAAKPVPLTGLGCFSHEAVAVDPVTGIVYLTEDDNQSGFYRFIPNEPGNLAAGGKLQMMKLVAAPNVFNQKIGHSGTSATYTYFDTGVGFAAGTTWDAQWVDIEDPTRAFVENNTNFYGGVRAQGFAQGATSIRRGEGCWYGNGQIFLCSTNGGAASRGQIFAFDPRTQTLTLVYESPNGSTLYQPDNIAWSPRGSLILCEDSDDRTEVEYLRGLTLDGTIFPFAASNVDFRSTGIGSYSRNGVTYNSDYRMKEFTGATFHNEWLFCNIQTPGITFAITGPWGNGAL